MDGLAHNLAGAAHDLNYAYTYNQAQELATHTWNNNLYQWLGSTKPNGTSTYSANGLNQYTSISGPGHSALPTQHDASGNLSAAHHWQYSYDTDNRLKTAASVDLATPTSAALSYDALGRLRQTSITISGSNALANLLYDGADLVAEYNGAGTLQRRYVHGPGVDEPLVWYEGTVTTAK